MRIALGGHPLLVYTVRYWSIIANDNGPLGLVILTPVVAVGSWLGWMDDVGLRRLLILGVFSIFSLLMAREAVAAIDRLRSALAMDERIVTLRDQVELGELDNPFSVQSCISVRRPDFDRRIAEPLGAHERAKSGGLAEPLATLQDR